MASKYPNICVAVCEKRVLGIMNLLKQKVNLILLDDAFQHRWVEPGLNILLTKYDNLFINDTLMPLGSLREHKKGYSRADIIVVTDTPKPLLPLDEYRLREQIAPAFDQKVCYSHINYLNPKSIIFPPFNNLTFVFLFVLTYLKDSYRLLKFQNQFEGISICFIPIEIKFHGKKSDFDSLILNYVEKNSFNE